MLLLHPLGKRHHLKVSRVMSDEDGSLKTILCESRGGRIRTGDPTVPNRVRYRAALHPELVTIIPSFTRSPHPAPTQRSPAPHRPVLSSPPAAESSARCCHTCRTPTASGHARKRP